MGAPSRSGPGRRLLLLGALCLASLSALAPAAASAAVLHVREAYAGSVSEPGAEYVQLQMASAGQAAIGGHHLRFYDATGAQVRDFVFPSGVANGDSQRSVLIATTAAKENAGIPAPDFELGTQASMDPAAGAVCFTGGATADCLTWGTFPPFGPLDSFPDPQQGQNAPAFGDGAALRRTIDRGCPTLLDDLDDSGSSAADFFPETIGAHNNSETPAEGPCPPQTGIDSFPVSPTKATAATFTYSALLAEPGTSFKCSLDSAAPGSYVDCTPGGTKTYAGPLADGVHTFRVYATGPGGPDPTPASYTWTVDTTVPDTFIDSGPPDPSSGFAATFAFHSSEPGSGFRCRLDGGPEQACSGSKTYINITSGVHVFSVYAVDNAGNLDPSPATRSFTVDNSIEDLTPPDTLVLTGPTNPSPSESASFTFASTEAGSSFQCRLDSAAFSVCPEAGVSYSRLRNGRHVFQVKATDKAGNPDAVPAAYEWVVAAPLPVAKIVAAPAGNATLKGGAKKLTVTFKLKADKPGSSFQCRLDKGAFKPCPATARLKAGVGRHRFEAYAVDSLGNVGTTIARRIFRVQRPRSGGLF